MAAPARVPSRPGEHTRVPGLSQPRGKGPRGPQAGASPHPAGGALWDVKGPACRETSARPRQPAWDGASLRAFPIRARSVPQGARPRAPAPWAGLVPTRLGKRLASLSVAACLLRRRQTLDLAGSGSTAQTRGSHLGRFSPPAASEGLCWRRRPEGLRLVAGMWPGCSPPPGAGRVKGPATKQAAVTGTRGSAAGTARLCQAPKGSRAKRGSAALAPCGVVQLPSCKGLCVGRGHTLQRRWWPFWHPSSAPLSPLHEGWTWPRVCQGAPTGLWLRTDVAWSRSGRCEASRCPAGAMLRHRGGGERAAVWDFGSGAVVSWRGSAGSWGAPSPAE